MKFRMQKCSPSKSPKKKKPVALVVGDSREIDETIRTEARTQMTHGLIEAYGLHRYMHQIPMSQGKMPFSGFGLTFFSAYRSAQMGP